MLKYLKGCVVGVAFSVGAAGVAWAETPKDTLVIASNLGDVISFDPAEVYEASGAMVTSSAYDRIMTFDPSDMETLIPGAIESYEISDDGKVISLKVRPDTKFASGNPVRAEDIAFSLQRVVKLNLAPSFLLRQFGWDAENVDAMVKVVDGNVTQITLNSELSPALALNALSSGIAAVVDKETVLEHEVDGDLGNGWLKTHTAGSGAYDLRNFKAGELILMNWNENSRFPEPAMKRVAVRSVPEPAAQRLLLEKGDVDIAESLSGDQLKGLDGKEGVKVVGYDTASQIYMSFNESNEILANPKVQEAIRYAVDYQGLADTVLDGSYKVHQTFWPSGLWASYTETPFSLNVEKAKALLDEAGYPDGFKIKFEALNYSPHKDIAQAVQSSLAQVGIDAELSLSEAKSLYPRYRAREHELILSAWSPDFADPHSNADTIALNPDNADEAKLTGKLAWRNYWSDEKFNAMTLEAASLKDADKRKAIYLEMQEEMMHDSPYVFMFQRIGKYGARSSVEGYKHGPIFDQIYIYPTTK